MKNALKFLSLSLILFFSASCIDIAAGKVANPDSAYTTKNGFVEAVFDRSYDSCWQITEEFVHSIDGKMTYHSQNQGVIKIEFAEGGMASFRVEKITNRATKVSLRSYKYGYPRNDLASAYFDPLAEKLQ
ncbi:MAG: DUF3568 family protein [Lentisphaerales bacterium]|nr:DUF3568 family protein [Lentisphaerales bacterium]